MMIADDAYSNLKNAYLFRGRVRKRFGSRLMIPATKPKQGYEQLASRLRIKVGTTNGAGALGATVVPGATGSIGQMFSVTSAAGTDIFTVTTNVAPFNLLSSRAGATGTFDTGTGTLTLAGSRIASDVYFYPSLPVMGLIVNEITGINNEPTYAFDTKFAYQFGLTGWERLGTKVWTGGNANFFWGETYRAANVNDDALYVTNNKDFVRYKTAAAGDFTDLQPFFYVTTPGDTEGTIETALIVIAFKGRLILMNIEERERLGGALQAPKRFRSRIRWCQDGDPTQADAWRDDITGKGEFLDLPTQEAIITAQHLRDRLIVYCERSTWELVYTNNEVQPFLWQQLNTELGAESTFSQVPFDQVVLGVGNVGVHACDGMGVKRIDDLIPDEVFAIHNEDDGVKRVFGIRDYFNEHVYWTFPSIRKTTTSPYPDQLLVFNYVARTWAFFDDSITCFGYIQEGYKTITWADLKAPFTWSQWLEPWGDENIEDNPLNRRIVAGNQEGFVFIIDSSKDLVTNAPALQITNMDVVTSNVTIIDHNLKVGDYVYADNCIYSDGSSGINTGIYLVDTVVDSNTITLNSATFTGTYLGGGTLARVSQIDILTKQFNFYKDQAVNLFISKIDFNVDKTESGAITVDYFSSSSDVSMNNEAALTGSRLGLPILETSAYALNAMEAKQAYVWHPFYIDGQGEFIQLRLYLSPEQMRDTAIMRSDFQLNMMCYYCSPLTRLG